jgi:hypothetical protein
MIIAATKRKIVAFLRKTADESALTNGTHRSRTIEEMRYHAGYAMGLRAAADYIEQLTNEDDDAFDD